MLIRSSFVDLLFILLCAAVVLLSQSIRLGAVEARPAKLGGGAVSAVTLDEVCVVVVGADDLHVGDEAAGDVAAAAAAVPSDAVVLLVSRDESVTHHRMMAVWSSFRELGVSAKLGAEPADDSKAGGGVGVARTSGNGERDR